MSVNYKTALVDTEKETNGDWVESPAFAGVSYFVRSLNYPAYVLARDQARQKLYRVAGNKPVPLDKWNEALGQLFAKYILLDVKGLVDGDRVVKVDEVRQDIATPAGRLILADIENAAATVGIRETEFVEELEKNSVKGSATS